MFVHFAKIQIGSSADRHYFRQCLFIQFFFLPKYLHLHSVTQSLCTVITYSNKVGTTKPFNYCGMCRGKHFSVSQVSDTALFSRMCVGLEKFSVIVYFFTYTSKKEKILTIHQWLNDNKILKLLN